MDTMNHFETFKDHPWHKRTYLKLGKKDVVFAINFLKSVSALTKDEQMQKCNRMFLDKDKPKKWKEINELCACAISRLP
jgi:hypothetical protein